MCAEMAIDYATNSVAPAPVLPAGAIPFDRDRWLNAPQEKPEAKPATEANGKRPRWGKNRSKR